ncbi:MAG: IPT/TIG domain-containing protein, partial [Tannerella sp.]|nr:IPT/TIG domain-containing protein [Tannerella sp.]
KQLGIIYFVVAIIIFWSCGGDKSDNFGRENYDPSKPVEITGFEPDSGGMSTKVFITGSNFGSDVSKIKVYFNDVPAPVIGSDGRHIYTITPRQPGRENVLSVVVNGDSTAFTQKKYLYRTMYVIQTISGRKGTTEFKGGRLSEAEFQYPSTITVDNEGNIFISHWRVPYCFVRINEEEDIVEAVLPGSATSSAYALGAPTVDANGVVSAIVDGGRTFYTFDPAEAWTPRQRSILPAGAEGVPFTFSTAHSLAAHPVTGELYTRYYASGHLVKINPNTREGSLVAETLTSSDSYLVFDPVNPNIIYISYSSLHCIGKYDLEKKEHTIFAGRNGEAGWQDGPLSEVRFRTPNQLIVAPNGNLYLADRGNHCIRMITLDENGGGVVSTVIGKGGVAGYQDGNPEDALFNNPRGVAVTPDGNIYITDYENNVVRKLTIE